VGDVVGLPATTPFLAGDPLTSTYPWSDKSPNQARAERQYIMTTEARENGFDTWDLRDGWRSFGPVSDRLIDLELNRLTRTYDSIAHHGFDASAGVMLGRVRLWGDDILVSPFHGWHRTAVLLTLGAQSIPMRFSHHEPVVRRNEVALWPNVVNGLFTVDEALQVFDRHFVALSLDGRPGGTAGPMHTF
jgi:hypothetical protein